MGRRSMCIVLILSTLTFLRCSCYSEKAPYQRLIKDATLAPSVSNYDYIVIGGGTAGCALAATLSKVATVLLLERGGSPYTNPNINSIQGFFSNLVNILPTSPAQMFVSTDGVINHRARVLGGGSAINAGFFSRASIEYVNQAGWDEKLVNESYEWVEKKVAFWPKVKRWQSTVRDGLLEAGVSPYNGFTTAHIYGTKIGRTIFDEQGYRHTSADLLEYAQVSNTFVYLNATAQQILFASGDVGQERARAIGVAFKDVKGNIHVAYLKNGSKNEIILSAGALGSPQLLMLSGVGPTQHLKSHNIKVVLDQPWVGQGMADNPMNAIIVPSPQPVKMSLVQVAGITRSGNIIEDAGSGSFSLIPFLDLARQLGLPFDQVKMSSFNLNSTFNAGIIIEKVYKPLSTGHMELETNDPNDNPKITFNYFKEPQDLQTCVKGMRTLIKVIESKSFLKFSYPLIPVQSLISLTMALPLNLRPKRVTDIFSLEDFCMDTVMSMWHYHGGCLVGKVVDNDYKVLGIDSLRVIDGSTFYNSPGTNPQATVMMLGRYMGQKILQDRYPSGRK